MCCAFSLNFIFKQDKSTSCSKMDQIVNVPIHMAKKYCHWVHRFHMMPTQFIELYSIASFTHATCKSQILGVAIK